MISLETIPHLGEEQRLTLEALASSRNLFIREAAWKRLQELNNKAKEKKPQRRKTVAVGAS